MDFLPDELILLIFESIPLITDKRHFLMVNIHYNRITTQSFMNYERNYTIKDFVKISEYSVEKFTLELCHDGYFDLIPDHYMISGNLIILSSLSYYGSIKLLSILKSKNLDLHNPYSVSDR